MPHRISIIRFFLLFLSLSACNSPEPQDTLLPVVVLQSGGETGAAFVVGMQRNYLYLLTAAQLLKAPEEAKVIFRGNHFINVEVVNIDKELDLAAIRCLLPDDMETPISYIYATSPLSENDKLTTIGHLPDHYWHINRRNQIKPHTDGVPYGKFALYSKSFGTSSIGSPVLDKRNALYGLVTQTDSVNTICLNTDILQQACRDWGVPENLMLGLNYATSYGKDKAALPQKGKTPHSPITYTDSLAGEMVLVKGGTFLMGNKERYPDELPIHPVTVSDFYLGKYEVTVGQYLAFCKMTNGHWPEWLEKGNNYHVETGEESDYSDMGYRKVGSENLPIVGVTWENAQAFIQWLSIKTGVTFRLPSEAEWEYAAGGGANNRTAWAGTNGAGLSEYVNFCDKNCTAPWAFNSLDDGHRYTAPVGTFLPNALGLYDMSGNVWEWCQDWYHASYKNAPNNGSAWENPIGPGRVIRGGSWKWMLAYSEITMRSDLRYWHSRDNLSKKHYFHCLDIGFRLARSL